MQSNGRAYISTESQQRYYGDQLIAPVITDPVQESLRLQSVQAALGTKIATINPQGAGTPCGEGANKD